MEIMFEAICRDAPAALCCIPDATRFAGFLSQVERLVRKENLKYVVAKPDGVSWIPGRLVQDGAKTVLVVSNGRFFFELTDATGQNVRTRHFYRKDLLDALARHQESFVMRYQPHGES